MFKDVIGHEDVKQRVIASLQKGRVSHAQLLTGATGYGTMALALAIAQYVFCTGDKKDDACGECAACRQMQKLNHPDLHFVYPVIKKPGKDTVSDDYMEAWRTMLLQTPYTSQEDWLASMKSEGNTLPLIYTAESDMILHCLSLKPFESDYRIMIIWLPENMRSECANKILKILEEPYDKTLFLLVSEHPDRLLATIQSRTQRITVPPIDGATIERQLADVCHLAPEKARDYARCAAGNWHTAMQLVEASEEQGFNEEKFISLMRLCWVRSMVPINDWVAEIAAIGRNRQKSFLAQALHTLRENFVRNFGHEQLNYMTESERTFAVKFSPYIHEGNIVALSDEFERAYRDISGNGSAKIIFTDLAIKVMQNIKPS